MNKAWTALCSFLFVTSVAFPVVTAAQSPKQIEMTIGYQSLWATVGEVFETLRNTNILALNGIDAKFQTFTYGGPLGEGFVAGQVDTLVAADAPVLRALARRKGKVINRTHDYRWGVVTATNFTGKSFADLKGKKLAGPFGTTVFPRTVRKLIEAGITSPFKELTVINQDIAEQAASLQSNSVDAVVTWDPTMSRLVSSGVGKILYESEIDEGPGWQGISQEFLNKYGEEGAVRYLKSWIMAVAWTSNNMNTAQEWFAKTSRLPVTLLKESQAQDRHLRSPVTDIKSIDLMITPKGVADAQAVMDFQVEQKLMSNPMSVESFIDMSYLKKAQAEIAAGKHPSLKEIKITSK